MIKKVFLLLLLVIFLSLSFIFYNFSQAQTIAPPGILQQGGNQFVPNDPEAPIKKSEDITGFFNKIFKMIAQIFWIFAVGATFYAGYLYIFSGGVEEKTGKAKKMLWYAIIAIVIGLMAYGLPQLVKNFLSPDNNSQEQSPPGTIKV
jgi:hypothetical protein